MRRGTVCASAVVVTAMASASHAQPFANARSSQAGFSGGDLEPAAACEQLDARGIADDPDPDEA